MYHKDFLSILYFYGFYVEISDCYSCDNPKLPVEDGYYVIENVKTDIDNEDHVFATIPPGFSIRQSTIPNAGLGVFAETDIPNGTRLGPYNGVVYNIFPFEDYSYVFNVEYSNFEIKHSIDAKLKNKASWTRYVNCARTVDEENLFVYQYQFEIYLVTYECIKRGTELLFWYGENYGKYLGLRRQHSDYEKRFGDSRKRSVLNNVVQPSVQRFSSNCYQFVDQPPFVNPPNSNENHSLLCLSEITFDVCKYVACDMNPCTQEYDCMECPGYCFHLGKYFEPKQEFIHGDNVNICICNMHGDMPCTTFPNTYTKMCRY